MTVKAEDRGESVPNADALWWSPCGRKREPVPPWAGEPTVEVGADEMRGDVVVEDDDDDGGAKSAVVMEAMSTPESESI